MRCCFEIGVSYLSAYAEDHRLCPWMNAIKNASVDVAETAGG
jgi:hypothetical protein